MLEAGNPTPCLPDALLFDFDGVLADTEPIHWQCWRSILEPLGLMLTWEVYEAQCIGVSDKEMLLTLGRMKEPPISLDVLWPLYPEKKELFREETRKVNPVPENTLRVLKSFCHIPMGVVTSSGRSEVEPILVRSGVSALLRTAVYGEDVRRLKPDPEPYRKAAERLNAKNCIVFEDSPAGRASGRAAGFQVVEVERASDLANLVVDAVSNFR